ncbi:MAG TPA: acetolactate synthase large subunit [Blastocatellia bacterium]|nr:acetolactate synthase large subunit [Blastocatellia bacterium]
MNGAESLIQTLIKAGLDLCFANPGTTEMPLVRALDEVSGMRAVLCLFEGVCTGAADGYARMAGRPGVTLLHLGPGLANGLTYLHNARRAHSPIVNLVGDQASWHLAADAPLTSDVETLARPVSAWVRRSVSAEALAGDAVEAVAAATKRPGQISTMILPVDYQMGPATGIASLESSPLSSAVNGEAIEQAARVLRGGEPAVLILGGEAMRGRALSVAARIAAAGGCHLMCEAFPARWERGVGTPVIERLPYFPEQALAALSPFKSVILAGAEPPVSFFGYPGVPSFLISPNQQTTVLATPEDDVLAALEALADELEAPLQVEINPHVQAPPLPTGALTPETLSAAVAAVVPENSIIVDEGITSTRPFCGLSQRVRPHTYLAITGGAIGWGLPCATGAAVASPDRTVITLEADGSAMYTLQALWTQAREQLNVKTIICNNRSYRILGLELRRAGVVEFGRQARNLMDLVPPAIDWVGLSKSLGVPAVKVETAEALIAELARALSEPGPRLIEAVM